MGTFPLNIIYMVFYTILHSVYTIFEWFSCVTIKLKFKFNAFCHEVLPFKQTYIYPNLHKFDKIPTHLTVLLGHEEASLKDLANLVIWCLAARINYISFYDYKGALKEYEDELQCMIDDKKSKADHVIWHNKSNFLHKNGYLGRKIHVKILTDDDGRRGVVNLCKQLASNGAKHFQLDTINEGLVKTFEFPDPDVGLCCGKTLSLYNYPPWQLRVTEFYQLETHHNININDFAQLLVRYSKCEQRFGK